MQYTRQRGTGFPMFPSLDDAVSWTVKNIYGASRLFAILSSLLFRLGSIRVDEMMRVLHVDFSE